MSIPGLGQAVPKATQLAPTLAASVATHELQANSEWRFEVPLGQSIQIRVLSGTAELFGTELALNHIYTFRNGTKAAIFTWHGTRLEVTGQCEEYTAEETPMISYINTHAALERLRDEAESSNSTGPRVLVVGPSNSGKTSLVKILTAYAMRMGRQPIVINTDSREGVLSIPGSLTATPFASIIDVEQGWGSSPMSTSSPVPVKLPLCYYYGLPSPEDNPKLYKPVVTRLALAARGRLADDKVVRESGIIVDTPGVISQGKNGYDLIGHLVSDFSINAIISLGSERVHNDLLKRFATTKTPSGEPIEIVKLDKSGGCVDREEPYLSSLRTLSIKEYFDGDSKTKLSPHTQLLSFDDITILKIRDGSSSPGSSFLPGGAEETTTSSHSGSGPPQGIYEIATPTPEMAHCVLAIPHASKNDSHETVRDASIMGFVYVSEVDEKKKRMKVLAPVTTRIGGVDRVLIWGSWPGTVVGLMD